MSRDEKGLELVAHLVEIAVELDKGNEADISWLKYQGNVLREAVELILSTAPTALPVCTSCGKSTRSHTRPRYCRVCSDALDTFAQKFAPLPLKEI
jgi:hypothetical protein